MITVWKGAVTFDEWILHLKKVFADPEFSSMFKHIIDLRAASTELIGIPEISFIAEFIRSHGEKIGNRTIAVIATEGFAKSVFFQQLLKLQSVNIIVFSDLSTSCIWLGADPVEIETHIEHIHDEM